MTFLFICMALMVLQCHARILINQNHVEMEDFVNPPVKQLYRVALDETPSFTKGNKAMRDKLLLRAWMVSFKKVFYSFIQNSCFLLQVYMMINNFGDKDNGEMDHPHNQDLKDYFKVLQDIVPMLAKSKNVLEHDY